MVYSVINILHNSLLFSRSFLVFFHFAHSLLHFPASLCVYSTFLSVTSHSYYFLMWLAVFWVPVLLSNWIYLCLIIFGKCVPFLSLNDLVGLSPSYSCVSHCFIFLLPSDFLFELWIILPYSYSTFFFLNQKVRLRMIFLFTTYSLFVPLFWSAKDSIIVYKQASAH